ncbi:MAG TPA: adenosine kinase [Azospirillaceae bacterium]|nr:adenosine kinase [Azospirillaceae bacterium]
MTNAAFDVVGIGNAIVDVISRTDEGFITANNLVKGAMTLIDAARAEELYARMPAGIEMSGGSAGNTMAGFAQLGGRGAYIGKVHDDQLGTVFRHDMRAMGVAFDTAPLTDGPSTARCLIVVTPDAQRTMNTYLGACVQLGPDDIDAGLIGSAKVTYMEGYLFDPPQAKAAFRKAAEIAHANGREVSLTLSDSFCVHRHRADFMDLIDTQVDILFANRDEITAMFETDDLDTALAALRGRCKMAAVTLSEQGSVVLAGGEIIRVPAEPVTKLVDTTGAGDLYAAGFLRGYTQGRSPADCARLGSICAAEIISHVGARPEANLQDLAAAKGL